MSKFVTAVVAAGITTFSLADSSAAQRMSALPREKPVNTSTGRRFVSYPRWEDPVRYTLAELKNGREVPYPAAGVIQRGNVRDPQNNMVSLQGLIVDGRDRLWVLDTGTINMKPIRPFVPKLIGIDTRTNSVIKTIKFDRNAVPDTSYLNDLRIDGRVGAGGVAYITGQTQRRLAGHPSVKAEPNFVAFVEGHALFKRPKPGQASHLGSGADGIAISADGTKLFWTPWASRKLYSISTAALRDAKVLDDALAQQVVDHGQKGTADGLGEDTANRIYVTNWEQNAINRRLPNGLFETVVHDDRLLWPDTMVIGRDGYLYVIANQLHRQGGYNEGRDRREKPYSLFRVKVDAKPVVLR